MNAPITFADYARDVARTRDPRLSSKEALAHHALGLAGEAGECIELVKKHLFHDAPLDAERVREELGDALFYLAAMAEALDSSLGDVAITNVEKRQRRYPNGFVPGGGVR